MDIHITLNTHFIGTFHPSLGTLPLSVMSQADGLSYIQTVSLRQHNWGYRRQIGAQLRGHRPMIETRHQIL